MSKYRETVTNNFRTFSLFKETNNFTKNYDAVWTLKDDDHDGYPSLRRIYLSYMDPTEYRFAKEVFDSWEHWERLCRCTFFKPYIKKWRYELEVALRSQAIYNIVDSSKGAKGFAAAKWLAEKGWDQHTRGRPKKEDIEKEAKIQAELENSMKDYAERVGLNEPSQE